MNMTLTKPQLESDNSKVAFDNSYLGFFVNLKRCVNLKCAKCILKEHFLHYTTQKCQ
jgi:hypothetical protein